MDGRTAIIAGVCTCAVLAFAGRATAQIFYYPEGSYTIDAQMIGNGVKVGEDENGRWSDPNSGDPYHADVTITAGGSVPSVSVFNTSTLTLSGGDLSFGLETYDSASATINSGTFEYGCIADGTSSIVIKGGTSIAGARATEEGKLTISGGVLQSGASSWFFGTVLVTGGTMSYVAANDAGSVTVSGGTFTDTVDPQFQDATNGSFTFVGSGLIATDLGPINLGEEYLLTGNLADGSSVDGDTVEVYSGAAGFTPVNSVPEPASLAGLMLGAAIMFRRRRPRLR